jgi:hypothetical protein
MTARPAAAFAIAIFALAASLHAACPDAPTFTPGHYAVSGVDPFVGFIRDLNGDGKGDLVVFYNTSGGFQVFLGSASGVLVPTPAQFASNSTFSSIAPGDLNGDGNVDIVAGVNSEIRVYYGVGNATFTAGPVFTLPGGSGAPTERVGDFDNDGLPDIVAGNIGGHLLVFRQTSPGTFAPPTDTAVVSPNDMEIGDLDGDGKLDVVVTSDNQTVSVFFGNGDGTFAAPVIIDLSGMTIGPTDSVVIHDFNFDGRPDLAVGVVNRGIQIVRNDGNRTFSLAQLIPEPQGGSVQIADFNYDGITDLFASGYGGFYIVLANADGTFRTPQFTAVPPLGSGSSAFRSRYDLGDFRGLHRVDVATTKFFPAPQTIEVDLNDCGPPPVLTSVTPSSGPASGGNSVQLHGDNFFVPQQVLFGSTPATITASTPTVVTVTAPAHAPAIVAVSISTPDGTATLNDAYAFVGPSTTSIVVDSFIAASRPFAITAIVSPPPNGGTVTFSIDGIPAGTANVNGNTATLTATAPSALGPHVIGAHFNGVAIYSPSSAAVAVTVLADIPALSPLALALLAAMFGVCGAIVLRSAGR